MTSIKNQAKEKLHKMKKDLDNRLSKYEELGDMLDDDGDNMLIGPTNDIQLAQIKKEIRESSEDE